MSTTAFIQAMPKVELNVSLEGALLRTTLVNIAEGNEIHTTLKHYQQWLGLFDKPDYRRLPDIIKTHTGWLRYDEELIRMVYDLGVQLAKQNVRYAEVSLSPLLFEALGLSLDDLLAALNDGRDRAKRGWQVEMNWIISVPREEPRRAEEIARWATGLTARRGNVVGIALNGKDDVQPLAQFERAFKNAEKKDVPRVVRAGDGQGADGVIAAVRTLNPNRINDAWKLADSDEAIAAVRESGAAVVVGLSRALKHGWVSSAADYPLRRLIDAGLPVVLATDLPALYKTTLNDEYALAVDKLGVSLGELTEMALNAVRASFLPAEAKASVVQSFTDEYARLREGTTTA